MRQEKFGRCIKVLDTYRATTTTALPWWIIITWKKRMIQSMLFYHEMFFLPAELAKEARNEVLSH